MSSAIGHSSLPARAARTLLIRAGPEGLNLAGARHLPGDSSVQATPQPSGHRDCGTATEGFDVLERYEDN